jgi:hypothetical protein
MERNLLKSAKYKRWADNLEGSALAQISSMGLMNYLLTEETE